MDKLLKKTNLALVVGSSSWREQFVNAVTVSAGMPLPVCSFLHSVQCSSIAMKYFLIKHTIYSTIIQAFFRFKSRLFHFDPSGDDDEEESGEERLPSCFDYIMHFLTVFWKVLFAFVPPTEYWNGWACFIVSIGLIGVLTAITGDLASHFGCTVGLKDSVTAVVFVALGTSVPG